jgi:FtsZ-binding cell division protein ZapB
VIVREERLEAIAKIRAALDQEEIQLKEELACWAHKLHKSLFGWHEGDD